MGICQGKGVGTSSPQSHISRMRVSTSGQASCTVWKGARSHYSRWVLLTDVPNSILWISFSLRQRGWEWPLAPAGLLPESPCPMGQPLPMEDAVGLRPLEEEPGPEDKMTGAVQAAEGSGGSWIPTDAGAKLSSPWMCSSSAPGAHGTPARSSPGHRTGSRRCRQAPVTHGMGTGSSAGPGSPGRQQQSEIYSTKQPENKPKECLFFFLCDREIKPDCLSPGNAGTPAAAPPRRSRSGWTLPALSQCCTGRRFMECLNRWAGAHWERSQGATGAPATAGDTRAFLPPSTAPGLRAMDTHRREPPPPPQSCLSPPRGGASVAEEGWDLLSGLSCWAHTLHSSCALP